MFALLAVGGALLIHYLGTGDGRQLGLYVHVLVAYLVERHQLVLGGVHTKLVVLL